MRNLILLVLFVSIKAEATQWPIGSLVTNWQSINDAQGRFICDFPAGYAYHTEADVLFYAARADSITLEIHHAFEIVPILPLSGNTPSIISPISQALNAYAGYLVQITNGQVVNQTDINTNGKVGREINLTYYDSSNSIVLRRIFMRVYWDGSKMHVFSLEAETTYDATLTLYKDMLFNSIQFY